MTAPNAVGGPPAAALSAAYVAQQQATRQSVLRQLAALWSALTTWRTPDADKFAAQAAAVVSGGQQRVGALTAAYLLRQLAAGGVTAPAPRLKVSDQDIRGVDARQVYRRPFEQLWWDLSRNVPLDAAVERAGQRVQVTAATDLQLAKTHASAAVLAGAGDKVVGYRRVLTGNYSCALCLIASTQRYHKSALLPIHPRCDCAIEPIIGGRDPGHVINEQLLNAIHDAVAKDLGDKYVDRGARGPLDYRKVLIDHQHSELGPVLAVNGQNWQADPT